MGYTISKERLQKELLFILILIVCIGTAMGLLYWYDTQHQVVSRWAQDFYSFLLRE